MSRWPVKTRGFGGYQSLDARESPMRWPNEDCRDISTAVSAFFKIRLIYSASVKYWLTPSRMTPWRLPTSGACEAYQHAPEVGQARGHVISRMRRRDPGAERAAPPCHEARSGRRPDMNICATDACFDCQLRRGDGKSWCYVDQAGRKKTFGQLSPTLLHRSEALAFIVINSTCINPAL